MVVVYRFHIPSDLLMERFSTGISALGRDTSGERQLALAEELQDSIARDLVKRIDALGIPASRSGNTLQPQPGCLMVQGQFVSRDQLDPSHRNAIGLEPTQSVVLIHVTVSELVANSSSLVMAFTTRAHSAAMPDALVNTRAWVGSAGSHGANPAHSAVERYRPQIDELAMQTATQASAELANYFREQGWISADQAKSHATSSP
ncbi:MAG: hypothetical protein ACYDC3_10310 [Candidatus Binataceae bacterium]